MEMEHAFAPSGSGDLHVDLRDDPACRGKHSTSSRAPLVFRLAPQAGRAEDRTRTSLLLSVDYCGGISAARHAPVITRRIDAAGRRARSSSVADSLAAGALSGRSDIHVFRLRGGDDNAVL